MTTHQRGSEQVVRKSWDEFYLGLAAEVATMSTCIRRHVGCILVDVDNRILSTGFNGVAPGWPHCTEGNPCPGATAESGTSLDLCYSSHSEANALMRCTDVARVHTVYVTCSPCVSCVKLLLGSGATKVVFRDEYPHPDARELWTRHPLRVKDRYGDRNYQRKWIKCQPRPDDESMLRQLATAFLDKVKLVESLESYRAVWQIATMHDCGYGGQTWEKERDALDEFLKGGSV